jgi:putative ABC transport system permease protein
MSVLSFLQIAFDALLRNKTRALLTMLGIIIGVASVIDMLAIGQGSKRSIEKQVSDMGSNLIIIMPAMQSRGGVQLGKTNSRSLSLEDASAIAANCKSIALLSPEVRNSGQCIYAHNNTPTDIYGVNEQYLGIKKLSILKGRIFTEKEIRSAAKVCLVGKTVIKNLFGDNVYPIGSVIRFNNIPLKIIGVLSPKGQNTFGQDQDDLLVAPYTTVQKRMLAIQHLQGIYASAVSEKESPIAEKEIERLLRFRHKLKGDAENDFDIRTQEELIKTFSSISDMLTILLGAIAGISLVVGGIGIMNIMYVSVTERTKEIGLRMSLGAKRKSIMIQFLTESILISAIGGVIGIILGIAVSEIIAYSLHWPVVILPQAVLLAFLFCSMIGTFFGWYPARKASRLDPIDALRYE